MILLLLNLLFNGFLLGLLYLFGAALIHKSPQPANWLFFGFGITAIMMLIGSSRIGVYFLKLYLDCRTPIDNEWQKLEPIIFEVINQVNRIKGTSYQIDNLKIVLVNNQIPNSEVVCSDTIILAEGLLNISEEDLKAVIAQALGHLYNRDSFILTALIFGTLATKIVRIIYTIYMMLFRIITVITGRFGKKGISLMPVIALIPFIIFLPVIILNWISNQFLDITLRFMCRQYEYRADKFAKEAGYKEGLINYLKTIHMMNKTKDGIIERILAIRPSAMKRISKL
jgi:Zn-dependent protease with chaperone function